MARSLRRSGYLEERGLSLEERWQGSCAHCGRPKNDNVSSDWAGVDQDFPRHLCGQCEEVKTLRRHRRILAWVLVAWIGVAAAFYVADHREPTDDPRDGTCYSMSGPEPC